MGAGRTDIFTLHEVEPGTGAFKQNISEDATFTGLGAIFASNSTLPGSGGLQPSINGTFVG